MALGDNYTGPVRTDMYPLRGYTGAGAPVNNTTLVNVAEKNAFYLDTTNSNLYICTASSAGVITWNLFTRA